MAATYYHFKTDGVYKVMKIKDDGSKELYKTISENDTDEETMDRIIEKLNK